METLWAAVLAQALADATNQSGFVAKDYTRRGVFLSPHEEARQWIKEGGPDFRAACHVAGVDPDALRERVLAGRIGDLTDRRRTSQTEGKAA